MQEGLRRRALPVVAVIADYLDSKTKENIPAKEITYEAMLTSPQFIEALHGQDLSESSSNKTSILESPRMRAAFRRMKQADWVTKWDAIRRAGNTGVLDNKSWSSSNEYGSAAYERDSAITAVADTFFGTNLISTTPPAKLKEYFERDHKIRGVYHSLAFLFKWPEEYRTHGHGLNSEDHGVANRVSPNEFVAVVIDEDVDEIDPEVLSAIPEKFPIINGKLEIIRMPKKTRRGLAESERAI